MGKFLTAGIIQRETIVKVPQLPIQYSRVTRCYDTAETHTMLPMH